jgi:lipopolysaccharide/colanic/teichoic acid biosynthesis glycosyltransferase
VTGSPARRRLRRSIKWIIDRIVAAILTVLLVPLLLVISAWILVDAGWPVLFVQRRVGQGGREFPMVKFRSMVVDAVRIGMAQGISPDPFAVVKDDPRITRSGRFLRRTGLDELPQLLNVLVGQMSLVGPRPDIPEQVRHYTEGDRRRLEVLPGITGFSQVHGRDDIEWPERIAQDIYYVDNWSLRLDALLIFRTFKEFVRSEPDPPLDQHNLRRAQGSETNREN